MQESSKERKFYNNSKLYTKLLKIVLEWNKVFYFKKKKMKFYTIIES